MTSAIATYNYSIEQEGEYQKFFYKKTPISLKMAGPLCIYTFIPAIFVAVQFHSPYSGIGSSIFIWLITMIAMAIGLLYLINFLRKPSEFKISDTQVVANGTTYDRKHISSFFIKTPSGETIGNTVIISHGNPMSLAGNVSNLSAGFQNFAQQNAQAMRKHIKDTQYKICIRFGSKDIAIAKGLGETDAEVLFNKIVEVAGLEKS